MSNCNDYKLTVPEHWTAEQAWAVVEFIAILNETAVAILHNEMDGSP